MNLIGAKNIETDRLLLMIPTMKEQYDLWNILRKENVNRWYMPTPDRFNGDRNAFQIALNDWNKQEKFYQMKIDSLNDNSNMFTWSIFLKDGTIIGQMTVQPKKEFPNNPEIRDVGWFINPKYQGQGYAYEAASAILDYMFYEVEIEKIQTSAAQVNNGSWGLMEKLGFERTGEKISTYLDENNEYLKSYTYELNCEKYLTNKKDSKKIAK